jgi:hypothetical protein
MPTFTVSQVAEAAAVAPGAEEEDEDEAAGLDALDGLDAQALSVSAPTAAARANALA